ncbi:MAG TPA: O-antigen ligase family protein [Casimicrobiaceae bacterium]|jgi:hypothetical protein
MTLLRDPRSVAATAVCAAVFFLASADRVFTFHVLSVNVRFANFALLAGLLIWIWRLVHGSRSEAVHLAIAWTPFLIVYAVTAVALRESFPSAVKIGWFGFSFLAAYAWTTLFDHRDVARAYFVCYLAIAAIVLVDFVNAFWRGPDHMIGFGQANDMVTGKLLFRPNAFYYEPSFAASSLALAWALSMTRMRDAGPRIAGALAGAGAVALLVMTSRTGWLLALLAAIALVVFHATSGRPITRRAVRRAAVPAMVGAALLLVVLAVSARNDAFEELLDKLSVVQAYERVCPRLAQEYGVDLGCLTGDARRQFVGPGQPVDPDETTEGLRLSAVRNAVATVSEHAWTGMGVPRGTDRLIAPPAVPNLWLEIAVEGGVVALLAFGFGIGYTLYRLHAFDLRHRDVLIVLVLWLCVGWQFIATFPRLDLWIAFWVVLAWMRGEAKDELVVRGERQSVGLKGFAALETATR